VSEAQATEAAHRDRATTFDSRWDMERPRVLIADDNLDAGEGLETLLKLVDDDEYDVLVTDDANAALRRAGDWKPHAAVLDIGTPGINGFALAVALREQHPDILLVALGGVLDEESTDRARLAGFDLTIEKGGDPLDYHVPFKSLIDDRLSGMRPQQP
jgi:CheY-like chemotaxis protein